MNLDLDFYNVFYIHFYITSGSYKLIPYCNLDVKLQKTNKQKQRNQHQISNESTSTMFLKTTTIKKPDPLLKAHSNLTMCVLHSL